jgi:predicted nucleotidyltransferase
MITIKGFETDNFEGRKIVLTSLVGSYAANLNTPASDRDIKYFVTPTFDDLYTGKMFSTSYISNAIDYDVHDIRQLGNLLWKSNLNFISVLFGAEADCVPELQWIFDNAPALSKMNLPYFCNAAMEMHYEKMKDVLSGKATGNTQVLVDQFGYDTKQACHALRCLYVLKRFKECGNMREALWFDGNDREILIGIKSGNLTLDEFVEYVTVWRETYVTSIKEWYNAYKPNEFLHEWFDSKIKEFIRANL